MSETPITPDDPDIPDDSPPAGDGAPEIDDQPLGVPADLDDEDAPLPGLPETEPPQGASRGREAARSPALRRR